ncbi:glucose 1-dehydrogenase [Candidatus Entotheonella palauensis]|uniref:glucose 1-dehydrogenase n=1 Tax=Candidatus Entotheonella palauensis TaxID=93172 RepID=UPI0004BA5357|nr:glucose 1-dehydrogenase [Candidatus Entotheonella palauensis]
MRFEGQVALVTGSSRGIGKSIALCLARDGADVVVHYRRQAEAAEAVASEIVGLGRRALVVQADFGEEAAVRQLFDRVQAVFGRLDLFVANAASTAFKPLLEVQKHHLDKTFQITLTSFVLAVQLAAALMRDGQGAIVTVSGIDARRYIPLHGALAAAKGALEVLTTYLACELAERGIRVNGVNPGFVDTDSAHVFGEDVYRLLETNIVAYTPKRRVGTPEDIANVVAFLCSREAAWMCGQTLMVDGGLSLTSPFDIRPLLAAQASTREPPT